MLLERRLDVVTFTTSSVELREPARRRSASDLLSTTLVASIDPVTAKRPAGTDQTTIMPAQCTVSALVRRLRNTSKSWRLPNAQRALKKVVDPVMR
jgi:hypothetical protein